MQILFVIDTKVIANRFCVLMSEQLLLVSLLVSIEVVVQYLGAFHVDLDLNGGTLNHHL